MSLQNEIKTVTSLRKEIAKVIKNATELMKLHRKEMNDIQFSSSKNISALERYIELSNKNDKLREQIKDAKKEINSITLMALV